MSAVEDYRELPYLKEGHVPEGEERSWGYRLDTERGYLYIAPLSGDELYLVSDCIDAEGLADKRGLTPRPYRFNVRLERSEEGWAPTGDSAHIGLMSGHPEGPQPEAQRQRTQERLEQFGGWLIEQATAWAEAHPDKLEAAALVNRHNRAVDLKQDIAMTESRLARLRAELLEVEGPSRPQLSDAPAPAPAVAESGTDIEH